MGWTLAVLPQSQADLTTDLDDDDCLLAAADALRCGQQSQLPSGGLVDRLGKVFVILWDGSRAWGTLVRLESFWAGIDECMGLVLFHHEPVRTAESNSESSSM